MTVTLTGTKITKIVATYQQYLTRKFMTIREVASLIGTLVSTFPGVQFGPLHYRKLERDKSLALRLSSGNFDSNMRLSQASPADSTWWVTSLPTAFRTIDHGTPSTEITTDASHIGWGAVVNGHKAQGLWSTCERALHINNLEMLAIKFGLTSLLDHTSDQHIRIQSDSLTAISYVMSMWGDVIWNSVTALEKRSGLGLLTITFGYLQHILQGN